MGTVCSVHQDRVMRDCPAKTSRSMRSGHSSGARRRTSRTRSAGNSASATCGRGWRWMPTRSSSPLPDRHPRRSGMPASSWKTWRAAGQPRPADHRRPPPIPDRRPWRLQGRRGLRQLVKLYGNEPKTSQSTRYSPGRLHRRRPARRERQPGSVEDLHQLHRAAEPDHADEHASVHPADQRLLKEGREPDRRRELAFAFYNFCRVHKTPGDNAGGGGWRDRPCVDTGRTDRAAGKAERVPIRRGSYKKTRDVRRATEISE